MIQPVYIQWQQLFNGLVFINAFVYTVWSTVNKQLCLYRTLKEIYGYEEFIYSDFFQRMVGGNCHLYVVTKKLPNQKFKSMIMSYSEKLSI